MDRSPSTRPDRTNWCGGRSLDRPPHHESANRLSTFATRRLQIRTAFSRRCRSLPNPSGCGDASDSRHGSPPRAWGQRGSVADERLDCRFTPTRVGTALKIPLLFLDPNQPYALELYEHPRRVASITDLEALLGIATIDHYCATTGSDLASFFTADRAPSRKLSRRILRL